MADNRKYYYLKLKESYFDDDAIVLLESMPDGMRFGETICCYAGTDQNNRQVEVKKLYWSSKQG